MALFEALQGIDTEPQSGDWGPRQSDAHTASRYTEMRAEA